MMRSGRWWIAGGVAAVIVAIVVLVAAMHRPSHVASDGAPRDATIPATPLVTATIATFTERITAQGRVGPPAGSSAKLAFAQSGILQSIAVRVGERVHAGAVLAALDRAALAAAVRSAQADVQAAGAGTAPVASVASANARLTVALGKLALLERGGPGALNARIAAQSVARQAALKVEADRAAMTRDRQLLAAGVIAGKDADAAAAQLASDEADVRSADANVDAAGTQYRSALQQARADVAGARSDVHVARGQASSAQARLQSANVAFAGGVLTAPADGIVLALFKHPGEAVDPATPAVELGPALSGAATLTVPAAAARRIAPGNGVTLSASGDAGATSATVVAVLPAVDPATQTATVVVAGAPSGAVPGAAVSASIVTSHRRGIVVPATAVVEDPQSGQTVVFVHNAHPKSGDPAFSMRAVTVGVSDDTTSLITAGLHAGERIAAAGGYMLLAPPGG